MLYREEQDRSIASEHLNNPIDSLYKNYFYKNRMLVFCSELLDRIEYELKEENDDPLSFISYMYLLIGSSQVLTSFARQYLAAFLNHFLS